MDTSKWKLLHSTENDKLELRILTYLLFSKDICHFVKIRNNVIKKSSLPDQNEIYVLVLAVITYLITISNYLARIYYIASLLVPKFNS